MLFSLSADDTIFTYGDDVQVRWTNRAKEPVHTIDICTNLQLMHPNEWMITIINNNNKSHPHTKWKLFYLG